MFERSPAASVYAVWQRIPLKIKVTYLSAFAIGLLTHAFMLTNILPNHDEIYLLVGNPDHFFAGRWFLKYPTAISSIFSMPWVNGILSITYISIAACLVVLLTKISKGLYCALVAGVMITVPTVASTLTYMQLADAYFFALMLACLAAFLAERYKYGYIAAVVPLVLSLGIYQSYFGVTAGLLLIILLRNILRDGSAPKKVLLNGVKYLGTLAAGMALYLVVVRLTTPAAGLSTYQDMERMGLVSLSELPASILSAYRWVVGYFALDLRNFHFPFMPVVFVISFLLCAALLALWCVRKKIHKEPLKMALLLVLLVLLPLGCNIVYLMGAFWVHDLMVYGTVLIPVFLLLIVDLYADDSFSKKKKDAALFLKAATLSCWVLTASVALCIFNYWITSNQAYIKLSYAYEQTYAQSLLLVSRIQAVDGYTGDTEIVLVGTPRLENGIPELNDITITAAYGVELFGDWSYAYYLQRYLNVTQKITFLRDGAISDQETAAIIAAMPLYPDAGSVSLINGKIFVNFAR